MTESDTHAPARHSHWRVSVETSGEHIVSIEPEMLAGREPSDADTIAIRTAAHHLLAFIGDHAQPQPVAYRWRGIGEWLFGCRAPDGLRAEPLYLAATPSKLTDWYDEEKLTVEQAWTILCETPDITSPEEYPDHALITMEQLASFMARAMPTPAPQLRVTNPTTIAQFVGALSDHGVKLPLLPTDDDVGTLVDADGKPILVVDVDRERSDDDVAWIVSLIQVAVNTCGGFKAQRQEGSDA